LIDSELNAEELDEETQQLWIELNQLEEVEKVERVPDPNPPEGNKASGGLGRIVTGRGNYSQWIEGTQIFRRSLW